MTADWPQILNDIRPFAYWAAILVIGLGLVQNAIYALQLVAAYTILRRRAPVAGNVSAWWRYSEGTVPVTLLVPAYNEEVTIVESTRSMLALHYPNFEVIVINDGSNDGTLKAVIDAFGLKKVHRAFEESIETEPIRGVYSSPRYPKLVVVDKVNGGGKADALNAGINVSRCPLFCAVDADSLLESDSLLRVVQAYADDPERVVAIGGTIRLANGCAVRAGRITKINLPTNLLAMFQTVEYLRAFLMGRLGWSKVNALMLISGAFGIFRRDIAIEVGGYSTDMVGEDLEIIIKFHRHMREQKRDYEIHFVPDPVCWTIVPEDLRSLGIQRRRWQRGALEAFFKHARMTCNPRYGRAGVLGFGNILIADVLAPPVEVLGYFLMPLFWLTGLLSWELFAAYLAVTFAFGVFISVGSLILEEMELKRFPRSSDLVLLTAAAVLENFGYRQINNLWRVGGWWQFLRKAEGWGEMTRKGFGPT